MTRQHGSIGNCCTLPPRNGCRCCCRIARILVRASEEKTKPNDQRLREYRDSALPSLEQELFSTAPIYKPLEAFTLADSLAQMRDAIGATLSRRGLGYCQ